MKHGLLVLLIAASGGVAARSGVEAIALTDIELVEGAGATVSLVDDKNCRLDGKVVLQKPVNTAPACDARWLGA